MHDKEECGQTHVILMSLLELLRIKTILIRACMESFLIISTLVRLPYYFLKRDKTSSCSWNADFYDPNKLRFPLPFQRNYFCFCFSDVKHSWSKRTLSCYLVSFILNFLANRAFSEVWRFSHFRVAFIKFRVYFWLELVQRKQKNAIFSANCTNYWYWRAVIWHIMVLQLPFLLAKSRFHVKFAKL